VPSQPASLALSVASFLIDADHVVAVGDVADHDPLGGGAEGGLVVAFPEADLAGRLQVRRAALGDVHEASAVGLDLVVLSVVEREPVALFGVGRAQVGVHRAGRALVRRGDPRLLEHGVAVDDQDLAPGREVHEERTVLERLQVCRPADVLDLAGALGACGDVVRREAPLVRDEERVAHHLILLIGR
jgi:hypothetical protein